MKKAKVIIYTDGGCAPNPGLGGWGAVLISPEHSNRAKELSGGKTATTNNRMELTAAIEALSSLKTPCDVDLHTDSQYMQKAFTENWLSNWQKNNWRTANKNPVANKDLWLKLLELTKIHDVKWLWVKGHSYNEYNDRCDYLACEARERLKGEN